MGQGTDAPSTQDPWLTPRDVARHLGGALSVQTLAHRRLAGTGPVYCKAGSRVLYRRSAVDSWLEQRRSTSDRG
jgi:hypothetical protein